MSKIITQIGPEYGFDIEPEKGIYAIIEVHENVAPDQLQRALKQVSVQANWDEEDNCMDMTTFRADLVSVLSQADYVLKGIEVVRFGFLAE